MTLVKKYKIKKIKVLRFEERHGFYATKKRSKLMSKIGAKETKPEKAFRKALWKLGIRYRKNYKLLPGNPDVVISKSRLVIFIDGEFWHGYKWQEKKKKIKTNRKFWIPKIERNIQRDNENRQILEAMGFKVIRFWDHQVNKDLDSCIKQIIGLLQP